MERAPAAGDPAPERAAVKHRAAHVQRQLPLAQSARQAAVDERAAVTEAVEEHRVHLERQVGDEVDELVGHVQQLARREEDVVGRADVADGDAPGGREETVIHQLGRAQVRDGGGFVWGELTWEHSGVT